MTEDELKKAIEDYIARNAETWKQEIEQMNADYSQQKLDDFRKEHQQKLAAKWTQEDAELAALFEQKIRKLLN